MARQKKTSNGYYRKTFMFGGKRYCVYGKDQRELVEKLALKRQELEEGVINHINPTLNSYYDYFTEVRIKEQRESTIRSQKVQFKLISDVKISKYMTFGEMRIKDISRRDIETARQMLLDHEKSPEYLNICFAHLNHVFEVAVMDDTIQKNPCKALKKLKRENESISENRHRALSEDESVMFFRASEERSSFYNNCFKLMVHTGMRVGEVGALYPTDIDSEFIHVRRSITRDASGAYRVGEDTKTYSGKRDIPLNSELKAILKQQRELNNMVFGLGWTGTLFKSAEGDLLREYSVNREIKRICTKANIDRFTCHGFRVTFATRFIEQRPQDYKILSEILGHKDIAITLNLYTRVMKENKINAMNDLIIKTS